MDSIVWLHRRLQRIVDVLRIRPLAQRCFRALLAWRGGNAALVSATQNGRLWRLAPEVALRGEFAEFETIEWLRQVIQPGMCVYDIGANVGQMTLEMAYLVGPTGQVVSVEPAPGNLALLRRHVEGNGFSDRVQIVAAACSEKADELIAMKIFGDSEKAVGSGHTLIVDRAGDEASSKMPSTTTMVETTTLDRLCERLQLIPAVLKIDVEGAELQVLRGATKVLAMHRPVLRFGFHPFSFADPAAATQEIQQLLARASYELAEDAAGLAAFELAEYNAAVRQPLPGAAPAGSISTLL